MKKVLVSGANGFIGSKLCARLAPSGYQVTGILRDRSFPLPSGTAPFYISSLCDSIDWNSLWNGIDTVIHTAARVHVMKDKAANPYEEYKKVNYEGTVTLAKKALESGVRLFIHLSTAKVNGEGKDSPYTEADKETPLDPYGLTKLEAERELNALSRAGGMKVVHLRLPLVYGPGVRANFFNLMKAIEKGYPLPLKGIQNKRSMIFTGNLLDAVLKIIESKTLSPVYFLSDGEDVSSPVLAIKIARALNRPCHLFRVPSVFLKTLAIMTGKKTITDRLTGSFTVDSSLFRKELSWTPPFTMEEGLAETARWFKS